MKNLRNELKGFTLIELLVVIAIIAILAAILFPVFAQAREKARSSTCLSNVKQLALGISMYAEDYDETMPMCYWYLSDWSKSSLWFQSTLPYVKNNKMYYCPSKKDAIYGYNGFVGGNDEGFCKVATLGQFNKPSETVLIIDCNNPSSIWMPGYGGWYGGTESQVPLRHNVAANVAFADGHAKLIKEKSPFLLFATEPYPGANNDYYNVIGWVK